MGGCVGPWPVALPWEVHVGDLAASLPNSLSWDSEEPLLQVGGVVSWWGAVCLSWPRSLGVMVHGR